MTNYQTAIKAWALEDRPREKLLEKGINSLSNAELLAILLGSGQQNVSAVELAKRILNSSDNNLHLLAKQSLDDLCKHKGIGKVKALTIIAAMELGRRRKAAEVLPSNHITSSKEAAQFFQSKLSDLPHEEFWILFLNRANKIIAIERLSQGGINATVIDVRLLLKHAINHLASAIIVCHNHPSGGLKPSEQDIGITKKIKQSAHLVDINLLDHIIVADKGYFSFADEGIL